MTKLNKPETRTAASPGPIQAEQIPSGETFEGHAGYGRDPQSELFLLGVTNMVGEDSFYEAAEERDKRFASLIHDVVQLDGGIEWLAGFWPWLRTETHLRTAPIVGAIETARAMKVLGRMGGRDMVASVLQRADEPGEALAYFRSRYGRSVPFNVKKGIALAARRLYNERSLLKYDTPSHGYRFGDVIDVTHPKPEGPAQAALFRHALDRRHGHGQNLEDIPEELAMVRANKIMRGRMPEAWLISENLRTAGMTWEDALSAVGDKLPKARVWSAVIPNMGYMALLRNLRNFDEAGLDPASADYVADKIASVEEVRRSKQLPMRFLTAYWNVPSNRWAWPLEQALEICLDNVPKLRGRTLILVDTSTSMHSPFSRASEINRWHVAAVFGVALARRCDQADVYSFSSTAKFWDDPHGAHTKEFPLVPGESLLKSLDRFKNGGWFLEGGTDTALALRQEYTGHDRVVILTDEQASQDLAEVSDSLPSTTPLITCNLAGYTYGHGPSGPNRVTVGGLSDKVFTMLALLEAGRGASDRQWPWEVARTS